MVKSFEELIRAINDVQESQHIYSSRLSNPHCTSIKNNSPLSDSIKAATDAFTGQCQCSCCLRKSNSYCTTIKDYLPIKPVFSRMMSIGGHEKTTAIVTMLYKFKNFKEKAKISAFYPTIEEERLVKSVSQYQPYIPFYLERKLIDNEMFMIILMYDSENRETEKWLSKFFLIN